MEATLPARQRGVPVPRERRHLVAWTRNRQPSKVHVAKSARSDELLCGFTVPPGADVVRGARKIDEADPFRESCIVCSDAIRGWTP